MASDSTAASPRSVGPAPSRASCNAERNAGEFSGTVVAALRLLWLGALIWMSVSARADDAPASAPSGSHGVASVAETRSSGELDRRPLVLRELPLRLQLYTRQVQVGGLQWVLHPGVGLSAEYPALRAGAFRFFPTWQLGFEHHAALHQRWSLGVAPSVRIALHPHLSLQLSAGVFAMHLRSLWDPYHFDQIHGTWSRGESESKWSWLFELEAGAWLDLDSRFSLGIHYGFGAIYPFAPVNDVPALPLTRLGVSGRWIFGA